MSLVIAALCLMTILCVRLVPETSGITLDGVPRGITAPGTDVSAPLDTA